MAKVATGFIESSPDRPNDQRNPVGMAPSDVEFLPEPDGHSRSGSAPC